MLSLASLHLVLLWACIAISIIVFSALLYSLIKHHKSLGIKFHKHLIVEIFWAIIPLFILIILAVPAVRLLL